MATASPTSASTRLSPRLTCSRASRRCDVNFVHSGWGGDRVSGGGGGPIDVRLRRDVIAYRPTVMTIMLGMNDGRYRTFDEAIFHEYASGYEKIIHDVKTALPDAAHHGHRAVSLRRRHARADFRLAVTTPFWSVTPSS